MNNYSNGCPSFIIMIFSERYKFKSKVQSKKKKNNNNRKTITLIQFISDFDVALQLWFSKTNET